MATAADVRAFYGGPPPYSMRAYVALLGGAPVALGGIAYRSDTLYAFMELKDEIRPYKVTIGKFARRLVDIFGAGLPGMTIAQPDEPTSARLLEWLGFEHVGSCDDGEVYRWRN